MPSTKEKKHFCPASSIEKRNHRMTCLGAIQGKVLAIERVSNKQNDKGQKSWKIRISEWKDSKFDQEYTICYSPEDYGKKPLRPFPKVGKIYWFFLHKVAGGSSKNNQRGWQWTHDWQLSEESDSDVTRKSNLWLWLIGGLIVLAVIIVVIIYFWKWR